MKRNIDKYLIEWKNQKTRLPLIIRGARQVGKTYTITQFGKNNFKNFVMINFEKQSELKLFFEKLNPKEILQKLEITLNISITPHDTLLFFDEIQECPNAIISLRYFKEEIPDFHIIAAGSLLEFALDEPQFRMPVGRIQFLYMYPLTFEEWLLATEKNSKLNFIKTVSLSDKYEPEIHQNFLEEFHTYCLIGGMPGVINKFIETSSYQSCLQEQTALIDTYSIDFNKYASKRKINHLKTIINKTPSLVGQQIKYSHFDSSSSSAHIKSGIHLLQKAGIITPIFHTHASGIPLGAQIKENIFKLLFLDIGLMHCQMGISADLFHTPNISLIHKGALAEQIAGQTLLTILPPYQTPQLFYWHRTEKNSQAEIDYVIQYGNQIIPIEVKAGKRGSLRALALFLKEKKQPTGIRLSTHPMSIQDELISIPLYLTGQINRLLSPDLSTAH